MTREHVLRFTRSSLIGACLLVAACGGGGGGGAAPTFNYATPAPTYTACTAIATNAPLLGSLVATTFSVAPPLPSGLTLDTNTGVVSGTPDALSGPSECTITAATNLGSATATLTITVASVAPAFTYASGELLTLGRGVALDAAPTVTAGAPSNFTITAGTLPDGYALDASTGAITGATPFSVFQVVTIRGTDCVGATADVDVTLDVQEPRARGAFVANGADGVVSCYLRRASDGALVAQDAVPSNAGSNLLIAAHPSGRFVYVTSNATQEIEVYAADSLTGRLSATGAALDLGATTISAIACEPRGESLYATTTDGLLHQFAVDASTGALSALAPATVATGTSPRALVVHPGGDFVYVANQNSQDIGIYTRDAGTGALTSAGTQAVGIGLFALAVHPDGTVLYTGGPATAELKGYAIDALTGLLTESSWSPLAMGHAGLLTLAAASTGVGLYGESVSLIDQWSLDANGAPTPLVPATVSLGSAVGFGMRLDPRAENLYAALNDDTLLVFDVDPTTGELTDADEPLFIGRPGGRFLEFQPAHADASFDTVGFFALDTTANQVHAFAFDATTGALTAVGSADTGDNECWSIAVHPNLPCLYVSNDNIPNVEGSVVAFNIGATQALSAFGSFGTDISLDGLALDASGRFLYQSLWDAAAVRIHAVNPITGALTDQGSATVGVNPGALAVHPGGRFLVVPNNDSDTLTVLTIDPTNGGLSGPGDLGTASASPYQCMFHPSGRFLYVVTLATGQIESFSVDVASPAIAALGAPANELDLTTYASVSPRGSFLVAVDANSDTLGVWSIDLDRSNATADGTLAFVGPTTIAGMDFLRTVEFDASGDWILITDSTGMVQVRPFSALGVVGSAVASASPGGFLRQAALRTRVR